MTGGSALDPLDGSRADYLNHADHRHLTKRDRTSPNGALIIGDIPIVVQEQKAVLEDCVNRATVAMF